MEKKFKKPRIRVSDVDTEAGRRMKSIVANYRRVEGGGPDVLFIDYCLRRFAADTGVSQQRLILSLMLAGMSTKDYASRFALYRSDWKECAAEVGVPVK